MKDNSSLLTNTNMSQPQSINNVIDLLRLISARIDEDNRKDGVELILYPEHAFRCLACSRVYTFRYDAERCKHDGFRTCR